MSLPIRARSLALSITTLAAMLTQGCGGSNDVDDPDLPPPSVLRLTLTGVVDGYLGSGLSLQAEYGYCASGGSTCASPEQRRETVEPTSSGRYVFPTAVPTGAAVRLFIAQHPSEPNQRCYFGIPGPDDLNPQTEVSIASLDLLNAQDNNVYCRYSVGGTVSGLGAGTLEIRDNAQGHLYRAQTNGSFMFSPLYARDDAYDVQITQQPPDRVCSLQNGAGVVEAGNVESIRIECETNQLIANVAGLVGSGFTLQLFVEVEVNGNTSMLMVNEDVIEADGPHLFRYELFAEQRYSVRIRQQPVDPVQQCEVVDGEGVVPNSDGNVINVEVRCPNPLRTYRFDTTLTISSPIEEAAASGTVRAGELYVEHAFEDRLAIPLGGLSGLAEEDLFRTLLDLQPSRAAVYSNESGFTYWLAAASPPTRLGPTPDRRIFSHWAELETHWRLRKLREDARFTLEFTDIRALGFYDQAGLFSNGSMTAGASQEIRAYLYTSDGRVDPDGPFYTIHGAIELKGTAQSASEVTWELVDPIEASADAALWSASQFDLDPARGVNVNDPRQVAYMTLREPIRVDIDLSSVPVGAEFLIQADAKVRANNTLSPEGGSVVFLRDPGEFEPGESQGGVTVVDATGLELLVIDEVPEIPNDMPTGSLPACEAPANERSTLEFETTQYRLDENAEGSRLVARVRRTGPLTGSVSANVRLLAGSASAGQDFEAQTLLVRFGDGSGGTRTLDLPIIDDVNAEGDETLTLELHSPQGCAVVGNQSIATITIVDDDTPAVESYTLSGTVSGLAGSGLTLTNVSTDPLAIASDGAFSWPRTFATGAAYRVRVSQQPENPRQSCTVANGEGFFASTNVDNLSVTCTTLGEGSGLDPAFGNAGRLTSTSFPAARAMTLQSDGRLVILGAGRLGRFMSDGTPDSTFGANGEVNVQFSSVARDRLNAIAAQDDGRLVIAGYSSTGANSPTQEDFVAARFLSDGNPDATFNGTGQVITDFESRGDSGEHVLLLADGRLVVTGNASIDAAGLADSNFAAVRYNVDGSLDTNFGGDGRVDVNVGGRTDLGYASVLQPDGRVVIAGRVASSGGSNPDVGLARFNNDGSLDTTFGSGGVMRDVTAYWDEAADIVVQSDGRLIVVGRSDVSGEPQLLVARYLSDGSPDATFGTNGRVTDAAITVGRAVAVQADGRIIATGDREGDFVLTRFTSEGAIDTSFGIDGQLTIDFFGNIDVPAALAIQPNGQIVVAGSARNGTSDILAVARVLP